MGDEQFDLAQHSGSPLMPPSERSDEDLRDYLLQVGHALSMVCELTEWLERVSLAKHLRHAVAESFAMNSRLLVEFLWSTSKRLTDVRASDYVGVGWCPSVDKGDKRSFGDKHVAHMAAERIDCPLASMTYGERRTIRDELLGAGREFAAAIRDPDAKDLMVTYLNHAESLTAWPPPPTGGEDPASFIAAIRHLQ